MASDPAILLQQLTALERQIFDFAATVPQNPLSSVGQTASLKTIKDFLQQQGGSSPGDQKQQAIAVLDRFLALTHTEQRPFAPLEGPQGQVRQFRNKLASLTEAQLSPSDRNDIAALLSQRHPVSMLLAIVENSAAIDDERLADLQSKLAQKLGHPLTIAAIRGKLAVGSEAPSVPAPAPAPAPLGKEGDILIWDAPKAQPQTASPVQFGAPSLGLSGPPTSTTSVVPLKVTVHIQGTGDREFSAGEFAGTRGQSKGIEGFAIVFGSAVAGVNLEYMVHLSGVGDTPWLSAGQFVGTRGENRRIEGFALRLTGTEAAQYRVCYSAHVQNMGDTPVASDGNYCGTRGKSLRVEGMRVWIEKR